MAAAVVRVRFTEGQFLGVDDLTVEQAYRDQAARRHQVGAHSWGIVSGLRLQPAAGGFAVTAGLAVDGFGRSLIVPNRLPVALATAGQWDVWLAFAPTGCASAVSGDATRICLAPAGPADPDPPGSGPGPALAGPPAPGSWPVRLGRVALTGSSPTDMSLTIAHRGRVYCGLTGEAVTAPSGRARMQVGAESLADGARFAVGTAAAVADPGAPLPTRLALNSSGELSVHGRTGVRGDLEILPLRGGGVRFRPGPAPVAASPWTLCRAVVERDGRPVDQLRIEIGHPGDGGEPARSRFVIGTRTDGPAAFRPGLSVAADGQVTVHGDLVVQGLLAEGPLAADPSDPRFAGAVADSFVRGAVGTATRVDGFFAVELGVAVVAVDEPVEAESCRIRITVSNTGSATATDAQIHFVIAVDGAERARDTLLTGGRFVPGTPTEHERLFAVPAGSTLTVSALAVAIGPSANVVSASGGLTADITPGQFP